MADVLDLTHSSRTSLTLAGWPFRSDCRVLQVAGGNPTPRRPLLWPTDTLPPEVLPLHDTAAAPFVTPDVFTHFARDVTIGGFGGHLQRGGRYLVNADAYPDYVGEFIRLGVSEEYWRIEPRDTVRRIDRAFVITHFNPMYGHWVLEILPKLFAIKALMAQGVKAPILVPSHIFPFVAAAIPHVLPGVEVIEYNRVLETVRLKQAILPGMMQRDYVFHPAFIAALDAWLAPLRANPGPETILVSRSGLRSSFRQLENVEALDETAARFGLTVIRPEELPWTEQVRIFASAKLVVGEYGSGMHNALFSPAGTKVVCLNVVNELQSRIANARGHDLGFILDPDGQPRLLGLGWDKQQGYRIDLPTFEARVGPLVEGLKR